MSLRPPISRTMRLLPRASTRLSLQPLPRCQFRSLTANSSNYAQPPRSSRTAHDRMSIHRLESQRRAYYKRRSVYAAAGLAIGLFAMFLTARAIEMQTPNKLDSGKRDDDPLVVLGRERKVVVQKLGEEPEEVKDVVDSGTTSVPNFPRVLDFYDDENEGKSSALGPAQIEDRLVEYQLLGLGIRTVSFLGIQVYVVGMYIATEDIAALQKCLIKKINPIASTLVAGEKEALKSLLYDTEKGEEAWGSVLKESGARVLLRIVPARNTDFHHLRDAWVRQITTRSKLPENKEEYNDETFGQSLQQFKGLLNRGSVPKGKEFLVSRDGKGRLAMWYNDGKDGAQRLGHVDDERISRALFLNYLAGKTVASEPARKSIVDGVMEFVERPVGTVAAQVHV